MIVDRRKLLQLTSAGMLSGRLPVVNAETCTNSNHGSITETKPYTAQFFTPEELTLLDRVMEAIIPADDHSPGAHEAQVPLFADLIVSTSPDDVKQDWRAGLKVLASELMTSPLDKVLAEPSMNQRNPQTVLDVFFVKLKQMTVEGYYTSRIGIHQDLQYEGNTYVKEFKGCTHAEHQTRARGLLGTDSCGPAALGDQQAG
jgi:hypothetical protein